MNKLGSTKGESLAKGHEVGKGWEAQALETQTNMTWCLSLGSSRQSRERTQKHGHGQDL